MNIDEAAQKIADAINEMRAAGYDVDWDRCDGGMWITRLVPYPEGTVGGRLRDRRMESRHVREQYDGSWAVSE